MYLYTYTAPEVQDSFNDSSIHGEDINADGATVPASTNVDTAHGDKVMVTILSYYHTTCKYIYV